MSARQPESAYGPVRWRWTWLKAYLRGMPLGYRAWRDRVDALLEAEARLLEWDGR